MVRFIVDMNMFQLFETGNRQFPLILLKCGRQDTQDSWKMAKGIVRELNLVTDKDPISTIMDALKGKSSASAEILEPAISCKRSGGQPLGNNEGGGLIS